MRKRTHSAFVCLVLALGLVVPASAQSSAEREKATAQRELSAAESALAAAKAAGAETLAPGLYGEAVSRIAIARGDWNSDKRENRNTATLRAIEATHASRAAQALAELVSANNEIRALRTAITTAGGRPVAVTLYDPPAAINRSGTTMDRVIIAENALATARAAGGESVEPTVLTHAEKTLETARSLARYQKQSDNADHLSFVAEMIARRAEYIARRNAIAHHLPALRDERARFATTQPQVVTTFDPRDRNARIDAERQLELVQRQYEQALREGNASQVEIDALRRRIDEQAVALRALQEREVAGETARANEIIALEQSLTRERNEGKLTTDALAQREEELRRQRDELDRLRREREENERMRLQAEERRTAAIAEAERLAAEAQQQSAELRDQVAAERARVAQTEAELARVREELARRDDANRQRIASMQAELAKLAETRTSDRGFIVTLPGLFFDTGKSALKTGARNALTKIAEQLRANADVRIAVEGHTDSVGSDELNQALSEKRAATVRDFLVARGIPAERITMTGLGETAPVATNDTAAGRQQNRRVEMVITQQPN